MMRSLGMIVVCCLLGPVSAGAEEKGVTYVDLQPQANQELTANFGSGREGNNLSELPKGEQTFKGVKFKVEDRFIQLGSELLRDPKPEEVKGIKVGKTFAKLHILHSTLYGNGSELGQEGMPGDPLFVAEGTKIGQYQVHYEDGTSEVVPIVYGQDVRDWWFTGVPKRVTRGKLAWEGDNELAKSFNTRLQVFVGTWENPHPKKKVASIDYKQGDPSPAAPFCIALTLEDK